MPNIIMADQPSGGGVELLASGSYTLSSSTNPMTIPISYSGTPVFFAVKGTLTGGTWAWLVAKFSEAVPDMEPSYYPSVTSLQVFTYSNQTAQGREPKMTVNPTNLVCYQRDSNYKIVEDTYTWSIWGVK